MEVYRGKPQLREFTRKWARTHLKRCGSLKVVSRMLRSNPIWWNYINFKAPITSHTPMAILSLESIRYLAEIEASSNIAKLLSIYEYSIITVLHSTIKSYLDSSDNNQQKRLKLLLLKLPKPPIAILFDEFISDVVEQAVNNSIGGEINKLRLIPSNTLFVESCHYLHLRYNINFCVAVVNNNDPYFQLCKSKGLPTVNLCTLLTDLLGTSFISPAISLVASESHNITKGQNLKYPVHMPSHSIEKGLKDGSLLSGRLQVFRHAPHEAEVELRRFDVFLGASTILILSREHMNRAIDGDIVAVCLNPRSMWKKIDIISSQQLPPQPSDYLFDEIDSETQTIDMKVANFSLSEASSNTGIEDDIDLIPTGYVVGIVKRQSLEFVAFIPESRSNNQDPNTVVSTSLFLKRDEYILVVPADRRIPKVRIKTRNRIELENCQVIVRVDLWLASSLFPDGHICRIIGKSSDWKTEVEALMLRHDVRPQPFSVKALACLPITPPCDLKKLKVIADGNSWVDSGWILPPSLCVGRRDVRQTRRVFSVDPKGCQDIDDSMSVHWVGPGRIEVTVYIADVCAFLEQGSALDLEAQAKGTTVYLPHRRYDMLPSLLSSDIASLQYNKDRLSVATSWLVDITHQDGSVVAPYDDFLSLDANSDIIFKLPGSGESEVSWTGRCIICSCAAMTYEQAHNLIAGRDPDPTKPHTPPGQAGQEVARHLWEGLRTDLRLLTVFSRFLKRGRMASGALEIIQSSGSEIKFTFDAEGEPTDTHGKEELEVHDTIAELMILSNSSVAKMLKVATPNEGLMRIHAPSVVKKMDDIYSIIQELQNANATSPKASVVELKQMLHDFRGILRKKLNVRSHDRKSNEEISDAERSAVELINTAVVKAMSEARYICSGALTGDLFVNIDGSKGTSQSSLLSGHYGLGLKFYTHFTSPIRRYADVIVHRQLIAILETVLPIINQNSTSDVPLALELMEYQSDGFSTTQLHYYLATLQEQSIRSQQRERYECPRPEFSLPDSSLPSALDELTQEIIPSRRPELTPQSDNVITDVAEPTLDTSDLNNLLDSLLLDSSVTSKIEKITDDTDMDELLDSLLGKEETEKSTNQVPANPIKPINDTGYMYSQFASVDTDMPSNTSNSRSVVPKKSVALLNHYSGTITVQSLTDIPSTIDKLRPYTGDEVDRMSSHLNIMNRNAKHVQSDCQQLFLYYYFKSRKEYHQALVYSLRSNGVQVFIPALNMKSSIYFTDRLGKFDQEFLHSLGVNSSLNSTELECILEDESLLVRHIVSPKKPLLHLTRLQQVNVSITASPEYLRYLSPFSVTLLTATNNFNLNAGLESNKSGVKSATTIGTVIESVISTESIQLKDIVATNDLAVKSSFRKQTNSMYQYFCNFSRANALTTLSVSSQIDHRKASQWRHSTHGAGRICFTAPDCSSIRYIYRDTTANQSQQGKFEAATEALGKGKSSAMARMAAWGEQWPEEEELPSGHSASDSFANDKGDRAGGDVVLRNDLRKDVSLASQRLKKLKIAKQKSKYS